MQYGFYKADTVAQLYPDGTVIWYVQTIYTSTCKMHVRWFPFDVQVCEMRFLSWAYNGLEIDLQQENSLDALEYKFLSNGVWDMVAVRTKRVIVKYLCCLEPYPEVHYILVFKRHADFYVYYMILPCFLLSILSLVVFYLPSDCGEKLQYSATNLLALIVFQQIIAGNIPPTSDDSPLIGTYFLCMIVMVCVSVIATGIVMHVSALSQPVPRWVKLVFLHFLPRVLCLSPDPIENTLDGTKHFQIENPNSSESIESCVEDLHANHANQVSSKVTDNNITSIMNMMKEILETLRFMKTNLTNRNEQTLEQMQWRRVSIIVDRLLLNIFSLYMIVCTVYITVEILIGSEEEYEAVKLDLEENW
ncbi:neuronal acetylcholine receptor subunit alpha-3-like [Amphiura filiformis]|uniref:neuronal acetylcholine receptor subunit alpha-3-like n=1 Tax=Amphiura filiformis TaxID=82378 RepID=UPI003B21DC85